MITAVKQKEMLLEPEAYQILRKYDIPLPASRYVCQENEAVAAAKEIGYPVAMKVVSSDIAHKSDVGGVKLNLENESEVRKAYCNIMKLAEQYGHCVDGVLITEMIKDGVEVIIGCSEDAEFGKYIIFGLGGIFVELFKDVSVRVLPLTSVDVEQMICEVKSSKLLTGYRSEKAKYIKGVVDIILKLSKLIEEENIAEVDLNPVIVREDDVYVVDARVFVY